MIKMLIVVGTWGETLEKIGNVPVSEKLQCFVEELTAYVKSLSNETNVEFHNGGLFGQLETLADSTVDFDVTFWLPEIVTDETNKDVLENFPASRHVLFRTNVFSGEEIKKMIDYAGKYEFIR